MARNATDPSIASDGTLVYRDESTQQLVWLDRSGARMGTVGLPASGMYYPALSPDGRRVAVETWEEENLDVWVFDLPPRHKDSPDVPSGFGYSSSLGSRRRARGI